MLPCHSVTFSNFQISKFSNQSSSNLQIDHLQIFKSSNLQIFKFSNLHNLPLRYFHRIQNLINNILGRNILCFSFIRQPDPVPHHIIRNRPYILRYHISPPLDKCKRLCCKCEIDAGTRRCPQEISPWNFFSLYSAGNLEAKTISVI